MIGAAGALDGEYRKTTLPNGIRLVTEWIPHVRSVAVGVWVDTGSRHEPADLGGISHFIEHLVFKGTESRSAEDIARAVDSVGGQMDAFTTKEHTCFYVSVLDEHLPLAADLLADILLHPRFDAGDIEREKGVVLQEFGMVEDTPDDVIHDLFAERSGRSIRSAVRFSVTGRSCRASSGTPCWTTSARSTARSASRSPPPVTFATSNWWISWATGSSTSRQARMPRAADPPDLATSLDLIERPLEQVHFVLGGRGSRAGRSRALHAVPPEHDLRGEHVVAPVPTGAGAGGAGLLDPLGQCGLPGRWALLRVRGHGARALPAGGGADAPGVPLAAGRGRHRRRAPAGEGPSQGQPDALARVDRAAA